MEPTPHPNADRPEGPPERLGRSGLSRDQKLVAAGLLIAALGLVVAVTVPEIRCAVGLGCPAASEGPATADVASPSARAAPSESSSYGFSDYARTAWEIERSGRFLEREEFHESVEGDTVRWVGYVSNVRRDRRGLTLFMDEVPLTDSTLQALGRFPESALVAFDSSFATRLFALQRQDRVAVTGVIHVGSIPSIDGIDIERVPEAP